MLETNQDQPAVRGFIAALSGAYNLVVVQPTTLCNVNCSYCYLPDRRRRATMSIEVANAIARGVAAQNAQWPVTVLWHGGEPLATGREQFELLLAPFEEMRLAGRLEHHIQTNATLIDEAWCELFARYGFGVGVSIDGPRELNVNRIDWRGAETFDRVMRGISLLKAARIRFGLLAVVSPQTITRARELLEFVDELGVRHLAINIEEHENANCERPMVSRADAEGFWRDVLYYLRGDTTLQVREIAELAYYLDRRLAGTQNAVMPQPRATVAWNGDVVVTAPELAGATAPEHGNFVVGNVLETPLDVIIRSAAGAPYVRQYAAGLANCQASCSFWDYCQGRESPASRWFELRDFAGTETGYCRNKRQAPVIALAAALRAQTGATGPTSAIESVLAELTADPG
jgi:uncharacterized protein